MAANRRPVPQLSEAFGTSGQIIRAIPDATTGPGAGATSTITLEYSVDFSEDVTVIRNCNHPSFRDMEVELTFSANIVDAGHQDLRGTGIPPERARRPRPSKP